ncbi:phosphate signaling complex protein PhoU [Oceanotoga sp. DSM 15011]|jgi:phosphate transport system protein|uniref:Phosphate-specific transport system accessory protein PhoU n=1 Tax=Oceanotoga teriensis TaxID=515440 RepID=A0AA45C621_9BACT|nr:MULTISPECIES: phosphate signaling complex protein PhoU [Oceanotoga]PWJ90086.1 PhoU-like phosphate uptake regulator [Oceanotoga teriensis]UYP00488.1 phosphate signaling complex protein PhoU [Oceanotoga sp. DSM 15011]
MANMHHLDNELLILKADISKLLSLVLESFELSIKSLEDSDLYMADKVLEMDDSIDELNRKIEDSVYQIIARYNPLAKDLRYAITMIKFSNNLERIGDLSCNIANKLKRYSDYNLKGLLNKDIKRMFGISLQMLKDSFKAFGEKNIDIAVNTWKMDNKIDNIEDEIRNDAVKKMNEKEFDNELIVPYILIARDIERIADHATNLCEEILYIETGKEIDKYL